MAIYMCVCLQCYLFVCAKSLNYVCNYRWNRQYSMVSMIPNTQNSVLTMERTTFNYSKNCTLKMKQTRLISFVDFLLLFPSNFSLICLDAAAPSVEASKMLLIQHALRHLHR